MIYLNDQPLEVTRFPDGTSQVWKLPEELLKLALFSIEPYPVNVRWEYCSEGEFLQLAQLKNLLDKYNFRSSLTLKFLPYGRQDKEINNTATFALHTFASLINFLNFHAIVCYDPHSSVAKQLINNFLPIYPTKQIEVVLKETDTNIICYPDAGAREKYTEIYSLFLKPHIYGDKVRDQLTGNILSYQLVGDPKDKNVLIVDDICDGGMTFKLLAKDLLAAGAKEVNLFVTHGIFSKGLRTLKDSGIKRIFTQDGQAIERGSEKRIYYEALK